MDRGTHPLITTHSLWITILILTITLFAGIYAGANIRADRFKIIGTIVLIYAINLWMRADSRYDEKRGIFNGIFDMTWFMYNSGLLIVPYYLIKTRKWRGVIVMLLTLLAASILSLLGFIIGYGL